MDTKKFGRNSSFRAATPKSSNPLDGLLPASKQQPLVSTGGNKPYPSGGGSCGCDVQAVVAGCRGNAYGIDTLREGGFIPMVIPLCADRGDSVRNYGVPSPLNLPWWGAPAFLTRGLSLGPYQQLVANDVKAAGTLTLTLQAAAAASATAQGNRQRFLALVLEIGTSNNVSPGRTTLNIAGFTEDDQAITYTGVEVNQAVASNSQFLIIMSQQVSGLSIPVYADVRTDFKVVLGGTSIALTAGVAPNDATAIVPTSGIELPDRTMTVSITTGVTGTNYTVSTVVPTTEFFDMLSAIVGEMSANVLRAR